MHLSLKLINGEVLEYDISSESFTIGRSNRCEIVVPHEGVSRQHCQIEAEEGLLYVTDLGSTNGVIIDGEKIPPNVRTPFNPFVPISFGSVISMEVDISAPKPSKPATPPPVQNGSETRTLKIEVEDPLAVRNRSKKKSSKEKEKKKKAKNKTDDDDDDSSSGALSATNLVFAVVLIGLIYWYMAKG